MSSAPRSASRCAKAKSAFELRERPLRLGERRLVGPGIDDEEEVALLDEVPFAEGRALELAGDPGADLDGVDRFGAAGVFAGVRERRPRGRRRRLPA